MQFAVFLVVLSIAIISNGTVQRREMLFRDLLQRGKSIFSRSFWQFEEPEALNMVFPEHRAQYHREGMELLKDHSMPEAQSQRYSDSNEDHNIHNHPEQHEQHESTTEKNKGGYVLYRTDIIENDNLDLYGLIGGISFASLLATTLFVLGRNRRNTNGPFGKSLDQILGYSERKTLPRKNFDSVNYKF